MGRRGDRPKASHEPARHGRHASHVLCGPAQAATTCGGGNVGTRHHCRHHDRCIALATTTNNRHLRQHRLAVVCQPPYHQELGRHRPRPLHVRRSRHRTSRCTSRGMCWRRWGRRRHMARLRSPNGLVVQAHGHVNDMAQGEEQGSAWVVAMAAQNAGAGGGVAGGADALAHNAIRPAQTTRSRVSGISVATP